ncbi:Snf7-domain-containing protein [Endogone sp. FLAS-F59071]|nr:Snf7-domain-containing protein [Endogone sp. FLAS-F59071]|eukprot:RUS17182.1 Snf7-domain-containing protein [Endogone sp. FLAS-F59071]
MFKLFSKKPAAPKITSQDKAILDLKVQRDKLKQYQKKIKIVVDKEIEVAKKHLAAGDKRRALLALKKKKYQETLLERTDAQLMNLEELTNSIEYALVEKQVLDGLKAGNDVLKEIQREMSLEAVERLMDETAEAIAYQNVGGRGWGWGFVVVIGGEAGLRLRRVETRRLESCKVESRKIESRKIEYRRAETRRVAPEPRPPPYRPACCETCPRTDKIPMIEISEMLGSKITAEDEEEIEEELQKLLSPVSETEHESPRIHGQKLPAVPDTQLPPVQMPNVITVDDLPAVPTDEPTTEAPVRQKARSAKRREEEDAMLVA